MKNAAKFREAMYQTLTQDEWNELIKLVDKICDAHEDDKWWKVYNCIKTCVNHALLERVTVEEHTELCEKDEDNED